MKPLIFLLVMSITLISCEKEPVKPQTSSIIGRVLDKASGKSLSSAILILENKNNSYVSSTNMDGYFEFKEIENGDYTLISRKSIDATFTKSAKLGDEITDTLGSFTTNSNNWGDIYSQTFCSITGNIVIPGTNDYSEVTVKLLGTDKIALTTNKGFFRFDFLFPGKYDIKFEKEQLRDLKIIDIETAQGVELSIDTIMKPIHNVITIERDAITWATRPVQDFVYCNNKFWFLIGGEGLFSYQPETQTEKVELWENLGIDGPYGLAGVGSLTNCYDNTFWVCGDGMGIINRRVNSSPVSVIDSIQAYLAPYGLGWDKNTKSLIGVNWYSNIITLYNTIDNSKRQITLPLDLDYEEIEYKEAKTKYALVTPDRTFYLLIEKMDYLDRETKFIFIYNNIQDLKLLDTYVFPENYVLDNYEGLSFYENDIYLDGDKLIFN